jgi:hypothetical protein
VGAVGAVGESAAIQGAPAIASNIAATRFIVIATLIRFNGIPFW